MGREQPSSSTVVLETARLRLRPWRIADAAFHRQLWRERDPRVPPHRRIDADGHPTIAELQGWLRIYDHAPAPGLLVTELKSSGQRLGYCGLIPNSVGRPDEPELAFEFLRQFWNRGFATEASAAILAHARTLGYRHLDSTVRSWNGASLRVLEKLGFIYTGELEPDSAYGDSLLLQVTIEAPDAMCTP